MKKIIFGIFAHPDDEAIGPAGTLLLEAKAGTEIHLISLTAGESGMNPDNHADLGAVRLQEWRRAGSLIGATEMHHLGYQDGALSNTSLLDIAEKIEELVRNTLENEPADTSVEFMCFDLNGLTGHIDHIVASRAACLVFYRLKPYESRLERIRLFCLTRENHPDQDVSWIYMEPGRGKSEIGVTVDARGLRDEIIAIVRTHHTQRGDGESHIERSGDMLGLEHFIVKD
jgi:LmbE family N-acetylglucosaminyl deacetylase